MDIGMKYGSGLVTFDVPSACVGAVIRPRRPPATADTETCLAEALRPKLDAARQDCSGRDVLVLLPDGTRSVPHGAGYTALMPLLRQARSVRVLLATGTHKAQTPDNERILEAVRPVSAGEDIPLASAEAHDCEAAEFYAAGTTVRGNAVRLSGRVRQSDVVLIVAETAPHYFAGYSNAAKFLLPGVAAFDCIERDHAWTLDPLSSACRHPLHPDEARRANPVAEDQLEAARFVTAEMPVYALTMASGGGAVCWATFGRLEDSVAEGIRFVNSCLVERVDERFRCAVIGCGGYPNDETMYIAQRSLELTQEAIADGAEVLWLAECRNGIASSARAVENFFTPLKQDTAAYIERVRKKYVMYAHKTVRFARLMDRLKVLHVVSALPGGTFPAGRMVACPEPQAVVRRWIERGEKILFAGEANKLAVEGPPQGTA